MYRKDPIQDQCLSTSLNDITIRCKIGAVDLLTLGILSLLHTPSESSLSLISQAKIEGHSLLNSAILLTTGCVATLGFDPPIALGLMEPVS